MSPTVLLVTFDHAIPASEYETMARQAASPIAEIPGLVWKVFITKGPGRAGGVYLFRTSEAADAYAKGPILAALKGHPAVSNLRIEPFGILSEASSLTRGRLAGLV